MEIIVFEKEAYEALRNEMMQEIRDIVIDAKKEALKNSDPAADWLSPEEAHKLLGIKSKTKMQELRDMDEIRYSISGRIVKYSKKSLLDYLERHVPEL